MITQIISGATLMTVATLGLATELKPQNCQSNSCLSNISVSKNLPQNAIKLAWRPGYNNGSRPSSSSSSSWGSGWFADVPRKGPANKYGTIVFNPRESTFAAYNSNGDLVKSGRASGGMSWCDDVARSCRTPVGTFRIYRKGSEACISSKYPLDEGGGAPMPWCMHFRGGYAIHGSDYVPNRPASHGCIRVTPSNASWLHQNFVRIGTVVKVKSY